MFVGRSVGISRVCRVKSFEIQQSTRINFRRGENNFISREVSQIAGLSKGKREKKPCFDSSIGSCVRACVTEARATVYVCVHMPKECVCERKDVHACCRKKLAAQQRVSIVSQGNRTRCQWGKRTSGSTEAEEQAAARRERKRGADGDWESTPVPSRQAGDRETRSSCPSLWGVTAENSTNAVFHRRRAFLSVNCRGNSICLGSLLGADDRSFRRWCSGGQATRNVCLSNQTLSISSPTKTRTDSRSTRKTKQRVYLPLWKDSWKKHGGRL